MTTADENIEVIECILYEAYEERVKYYDLQGEYHKEISSKVKTGEWVNEPAKKLQDFREESEGWEQTLQRNIEQWKKGFDHF